MRKKQRDPLEAGTMIKQLASIFGMTLEQLAGSFADQKPSLQDHLFRHYLMGETPWPFEDIGYDDCLKMALNILKEQQSKGTLSEEDAKEKMREVEKILKVAFMDIDTLSFYGREEWEPTTNQIDSAIERIICDIKNLDIETCYVLNRYFEAFLSITERDLKWIEYLDCLGHDEKFPSWKEFERRLSKETIEVSGVLILENVNSKAFGQWLELLSKKSYKDTTRKMNSKKIEKLRVDIHKKLNLRKENLGLWGLIPLVNFIEYLIEKHDGSFFSMRQNYWKMFVSIKFWFSHFLEDPELIVNIY